MLTKDELLVQLDVIQLQIDWILLPSNAIRFPTETYLIDAPYR